MQRVLECNWYENQMQRSQGKFEQPTNFIKLIFGFGAFPGKLEMDRVHSESGFLDSKKSYAYLTLNCMTHKGPKAS